MSKSTSEPAATEAALEYLKQIITLSAGIVVFSGTFIEKAFGLSWYYISLLLLAWVAMIVSVICSLETISAIIKSRLDGDSSWSKDYGKRMASVSKYSFVAGLGLFAVFAFVLLLYQKPSGPIEVQIKNEGPIPVHLDKN